MALTNNINIRHSATQTQDTHESVLDMVVDTAPMQVPLMAMATRGTNPLSTTHEWVLDYAAPYPSATTGLVRGEGDDADPYLTAKRTRLFNYSHIWGRAWSVSHTQEMVNTIGIDSEFDYQAAKNARLTVRDYNYLLMNAVAVAEAGAPNAAGANRQMSGLRTLAYKLGSDHNGVASGGASAGPTHVTQHGSYINAAGTEVTTENFVDWESYFYSDGGLEADWASLTVSRLDDALKTVWERGGLNNGVIQVLCNGTLKSAISNLYGASLTAAAGRASTWRRDFGGTASTEIVLPVDTIVTDFGEMHVHLDQSVETDHIVGFDPEYFHLNVLRDFEVIELAKTGPSQHGMIEAEMSCSLLAPNTAFVIEGQKA